VKGATVAPAQTDGMVPVVMAGGVVTVTVSVVVTVPHTLLIV